MSTRDDDHEEEPLDPAVERVQQRLRGLLLRSSLIMLIGFATVIAAIIYKVTQNGEEAAAYQVPEIVTDQNLRRGAFPLPEGARVTGTSLDGERLSVSYELPSGGGGVLLIDVPSWQVFSVMDLSSR